MKKYFKRAAAILLLLCLVLGSVFLADRVLLIKRYDGVKPMQSLYAQEPNSIDLLLLGNSHIGTHVDTATLWKDCGISSFALWGGVQPMWNSYHYLVEALKTQSPKAVLLEIGGISYSWEYADEATQLKNIAGMAPSANKWEAVKASAPKDRRLDLMLGLPLYHQRYSELSREDFQYFPWSEEPKYDKGSWALYGSGNFDLGDPGDYENKAELPEKSLDYLMKIVELCRAEDIRLILVKTPTADLALYQPYCNSVEELANELGLEFYNFNLMYDELGLTGEDFYPDTHMNLMGARKLSRWIGENWQEELGLEDHRGDPDYDSWAVNAARIDLGYLRSITRAEDLVQELAYTGRDFILIKNGSWQDREPYTSLAESLSSLGIAPEELKAQESCAWLISGGETVASGNSLSCKDVSYEIDFEGAKVLENSVESLAFKDLGLTLLPLDAESGKAVDRIDLLHRDCFQISRP